MVFAKITLTDVNYIRLSILSASQRDSSPARVSDMHVCSQAFSSPSCEVTMCSRDVAVSGLSPKFIKHTCACVPFPDCMSCFVKQFKVRLGAPTTTSKLPTYSMESKQHNTPRCCTLANLSTIQPTSWHNWAWYLAHLPMHSAVTAPQEQRIIASMGVHIIAFFKIWCTQDFVLI